MIPFSPVFQIRDALIRIRGSVPLPNGPDPERALFSVIFKMPKRHRSVEIKH
jgi:hypothetical protein